MTNPLSVAWVTIPDDAGPRDAENGVGLDVTRVRVPELATLAWEKPGLQAVVFDVRAGDSAASELRAALDSCPVPALVRVSPDQFTAAVSVVRNIDDICLVTDDLGVVAYRVRRLLTSSDLDPLTQVLTRRAFHDRLTVALRAASPAMPLSLAFLDLDHFARINKEHSFLVGDRVLESTARLLQTGSGVLAGRLGGEEFVVLAPGLNEPDAMLYASELCERLAGYQSADGIAVTASIGVITVEEPGAEAATVLSDASLAMYSAKRSGRNRAVHFRDLEREAARAGQDVQIRAFEVHQRVVTERAIENIALRGRLLLEELQARAERDSLTGLFNRGYLDRRLPRACEEARGASRPLCVALIDVDHFGLVNKTYGWPTGDQTLREVADVIRQNVRAGDWIAKYGGEEIAVVLSATREEATIVVERIRNAVANHPFRTTAGLPHIVTISAGVVPVEPDETATQLWDRVSRKVLEAKGAGRNQIRA